METCLQIQILIGNQPCTALIDTGCQCSIIPEELYTGKEVPLRAWSGPECSRKLRFPDFVTTAQNGSKVVSLTHRPNFPPGNAPGIHFC